jgi:hypothetical protein
MVPLKNSLNERNEDLAITIETTNVGLVAMNADVDGVFYCLQARVQAPNVEGLAH